MLKIDYFAYSDFILFDLHMKELFTFDLLFQAVNITELEPHTFYTVRVSAFTATGEGPYAEFTVQTSEDGKLCLPFFLLL